MDPTGILTGLATELIKTGAGWLKEQAFGKPQQRALEQAATCAFRDLLSELQPQFPEKGAFDHLHSLLQMLVGDAPTAEALLAVALGKEAQPEGRLRACAEVAGIDTTSFPGDVTELLLRLAKLLSEEVYRRAEEPESPLYNLASLSSLTDMRRTLARLESRLDRFLAPYDHPAIDCRPAIEEFVTTYLGTPDEPVPFGGRDEALRLLDHWLFEQPDKPYALLAAPMGRGKSALLVRWHQRLLPRRDLQIVFFPVSIRFRLNAEDTVLRALTAALARLHGEKPEQLSRESAPVLRSMLADYLRRQQPPGGGRVLLILDGLDEAAGWDIGHGLLPGQPPAWLKVLISARTRPDDPDGRQWLEACGWTTDAGRPRNTVALFNLEVLDEPGVKQALKSMGFPLDRLGRKFLIVRELHRLCEGDVVLLRLYIDDLWQRGEEAARLKPEDLAQIKPGLEGYFERWWEDQKKLWGEDRAPEKIRQAQVLLCLLACAHGPLTRADLLALAKGELDAAGLESICRDLRRFLVGDGRNRGYAFGHPRLNEFFYQKYVESDPDARKKWPARFLEWGRRTLASLEAGMLPAQETPRYLLQYYTAHLKAQQAPVTDCAALLSNDWRRAQEQVAGSYSGFLAAAELAWQVAHEENEKAISGGGKGRYVGVQVRAALIISSVRSLSSNLPENLPAALVQAGLWTPAQAMEHIKEMIEARKQAYALCALMPYLPEWLHREAFNRMQAIEDEYHRAKALVALCSRISQQLLGEALAEVRSLGDEEHRAQALHALASRLPDSLIEEAFAMAQPIKSQWRRAKVLSAFVPRLPEPQRSQTVQMTLDAVRTMNDELRQAEILSALAPYMLECQLRESLETVKTIRHPEYQIKGLSALARYLPDSLLEGALHIALKIQNQEDRAKALITLAPHLPEAQLKKAILAARTIDSKRSRAEALAVLAKNLTEANRKKLLQEALQTAREIDLERERAEALTALVPHLVESMLSKTLEAVMTIENAQYRTQVLIALAMQLRESPRTELLKQALRHVRSMKDESRRAEVLASLSSQLPELDKTAGWQQKVTDSQKLKQTEDLLSALSAAQAIRDSGDRAIALSALVPHLPEALLREAFSAVRAIENERLRAEALAALAPHLPEVLLREAFSTVRAIEEEWLRAKTLSALAPHLPEALFGEALLAARAIEWERHRIEVFSVLAPRLPKSLLEQALHVARSFEDQQYRAVALASVAPRLLPPQRAELEREAFITARSIQDEEYRVKALILLAPLLTHSQLFEALLTVQAVDNKWHCVKGLILLSSRLTESKKKEAIQNALNLIWDIGNEECRIEALILVIPHLPNGTKGVVAQKTLNAAKAIGSNPRRSAFLTALLPYLPDAQRTHALQEALRAVRAIEHEWLRTKALSALAPYLPADDLARMAADTPGVWEEEDFLSALEKHPAAFVYGLWHQRLQTLARGRRRELLVFLSRSAPLLPHFATEEAISEIGQAIHDVGRWWP